jgi:hypothetical protein
MSQQSRWLAGKSSNIVMKCFITFIVFELNSCPFDRLFFIFTFYQIFLSFVMFEFITFFFRFWYNKFTFLLFSNNLCILFPYFAFLIPFLEWSLKILFDLNQSTFKIAYFVL